MEAEIMATIYNGKRWDISGGKEMLHRGTSDYLKAIGAEIVPDSAAEVPPEAIDGSGRYASSRSADAPRS
jgi:hypothetical protein